MENIQMYICDIPNEEVFDKNGNRVLGLFSKIDFD